LRSGRRIATLLAMNAIAFYRGRTVTDADVDFIRQLIADHPTLSRRALSQKLCEAWDWKQPNGHLRDMVCRGLMLKLHREQLIELPPPRQRNPNPLACRVPRGAGGGGGGSDAAARQLGVAGCLAF